jgi:TRAP-type mannitol/chloroaromatic compound transport system permease large subunit
MDYGSWVGLWTFVGMFALLMLGIPIFICLFAAAFVGSWLIGGPIYTLQQFASAPYYISSSYTFAVVPLFMLMSVLAANCDIAQSAYDAARKWLGGLRGGTPNCHSGSGRHFRGRVRLEYSHFGGICQNGLARTQ